MNWTGTPTSSLRRNISDLPARVGKAGASESVAIVAVIWGIIIISNA